MKIILVESAWPNTLGGYIGKLICKFKGHRRGKRVASASDTVRIILECDRCGATWTRKRRKLLS